jgi:hypothetical protein
MQMYIHQVQRGTEFTFTFEDGSVIDGIFDGNIDHISFYIIAPEISRSADHYTEMEPDVQFLSGESYFNFKAKCLGLTEKKEAIHDSLEFKVITPFKEVQRREDFRINIALKVRIHEHSDDFKKMYSNGWLCDALSEKKNKNGIRLFADYKITTPPGTYYTLEFSLKDGIFYMIPSRLMRNIPNKVTRSYNYDLGFVFDFTEIPDKREKLLLEILEYKMKNRL